VGSVRSRAASPSARRPLAAVVLAAGKGKRMKSSLPKVLHEVCGRPVLWHVVRAALAARPSSLWIVVAAERDEIERAVASWELPLAPGFVDQRVPHGTGHAVMAAEEATAGATDVLVLPGDEPLVTAEQVRALLATHRRRDVAAVVQTTVPDDPRGFARVVRTPNGEFLRLVEGSEATRDEFAITEVATSVYSFRREQLYEALPLVGRENRQHEYYLPDVLGILHDKGERIAVQLVDNGGSVGANSRAELAKAAVVMRSRINRRHLDAGVTLIDPAQTYVDVEVRIGADTTVLPMTVLEGETRIGRGCAIGPATRIADSRVGPGATVTFSVVRGARIGPRASVGPYASIRPDTVVEEGGKAGTFVEVKASRIGRGAKVPHLSYVGDADVGAGANLGAGTVTANYDGFAKHRTVVGDEAHVGSDTMLVAPVRIGRRAWTGAGSTITRDVPDGALGVERTEQRTIEGYDARIRAKHGGGAKGDAPSGKSDRRTRRGTG
jgi:bifunctional UDP-N-acetylglucosamine pyrophosphorylase/glucosamine-1-phosphate N-acetyltransferase